MGEIPTGTKEENSDALEIFPVQTIVPQCKPEDASHYEFDKIYTFLLLGFFGVLGYFSVGRYNYRVHL